MAVDYDALKEGQRKMWSTGDYPDIARTIAQVAEVVVERVGARPGVQLLDVATGTGNVAIPAALAGATVTGLDLTPELLSAAREPQGRWDELKGKLVELYRDANEAEDGSFRVQAEYLLTVAQLPA
jgi:2-polyprenyl-3-methyl-5-hydroxy-6-metoxy-1,4-benzoquinol methylase